MWLNNYPLRLIYVVIAALAAAPADAQVIVGRGAGISVNVPGVGGIRLGTPRIYARPYGRAIATPYGVAPSYAYPDGYAYPARPAAPSASLPTAGELRAMGDNELLNAVVGLTAQLDADLNRFDTGDTWQRYLHLPDDALPPPSADGRVELGLKSLVETLTRFDRTVAKPEFVQISGLPSYAATHAALAEVVRRYGEQASAPAVSTPAVARRTPPPVPVPPETSSNDGRRRGILLRNRHAARREAASDEPSAPLAQQRQSSAEELPIPPPALAAPQNNDSAERSILAD